MTPPIPGRPARIAVLASGGGSNFEAVAAHCAAHGGAAVALLVASAPGIGALDRAARLGVPAVVHPDAADGAGLAALLSAHDIGTVALAGYLRLVPAAVTAAWRHRVLNVHPALLPAFGGHGMYGRRVHAAVLAARARVSGCTVHLVDEAYDRGPIVAQWPVPVAPDDIPETLAARVLRAEHALFPPCVRALATGRLTVADDGSVSGLPALADDAAFTLGVTPDLAGAIARRIP